MREGKIPSLVFTMENNIYIINEMNGENFNGENKIIFSYLRGIAQVSIGSSQFKNNFRIKIMPHEKEGFVTVSVQNNLRRYPLPVIAECNGGSINFYTVIPLKRYCVDSAIAEYGNISPLNREAVFSLAHLVRARAEFNKRKPRHKDADFCDLTHCQVYRGIMTGGTSLADSWGIDISGCKDTVYFHASCGGESFDREVFGKSERKDSCDVNGSRDWLYRDGTRLCSGPKAGWSREIDMGELCSILFKNVTGGECRDMGVEYDRQARVVRVRTDKDSILYPPETFRLKVNRIKGWSYIKSNNYSITENAKNGKKGFILQGRGNGHGVGLCQEGAANLSRMGYNRYEIIEHYYPDRVPVARLRGDQMNPYLSYCIFDLTSGAILASNPGDRILQRRIPPGSIFKLFVTLFLAVERQDLFNEYTFTCAGNNIDDGTMPDRCWNRNGHGRLDIRGALAHSCNLYFASLHGRISYKDFKKFFDDFCSCIDIKAVLPDAGGEQQWAKMLAGLDFRADFNVRDYMRLVQFLSPNSVRMPKAGCLVLSEHEKSIIFQALCSTFTAGTASGKIKPYGSPINYSELGVWTNKSDKQDLPGEMWGKTATVLDGTNRPVSYGLFIGGCADRGIITLLRKGNGSLSARWARVLMKLHAGSR